MEGALKLKELAYVRAEAYPAGELKHGPIALIEPGSVVIGVATRTTLLEKLLSNISEVKARGATVVLVANDGDTETARHADAVLWSPPVRELFTPVVDIVPLQLFAYHVARLHGHDVDRPRNLAKTVTVE
jgi:glutamine---fructose-6-phosphate transaminase (isomerizing)